MSLFPKFDSRTISPSPTPAPAKPAKPAKVIPQTPKNTETLAGLATLAASEGRAALSKAGGDAPRGSADTSARLMGKLGVQPIFVADEILARLRIKELIATGELLGFDIETTPLPGHGDDPTLGPAGLDPHRSRIRTVQLYNGGGEAVVIDMTAVPASVLDPLWRANLVAHNAMVEMRFLDLIRRPAPTIQCIMLLAKHILSRKNNFGLAHLAEERLGFVVPKEGQTSDWGGELSEEQIAYAAADAVLARRLYDNFHPELLAASKAYDITVAAQPAIAWAVNRGVAFDAGRLLVLKEQWEKNRAAAQAKWQVVAPGVTPTKPTEMQPWLTQLLSPEQINAWPRTKSGKLSTTESVVAAKVRDVPELAPLRSLSKSQSRLSNCGKLPGFVNPVTGRIHPGYQLCGAITGRMSCSKPNIQSQEKGDLRTAYVAGPGRKLVGADWSMMELRAVAIISGDPKMLAALESGKDLHIQTAASVTGKPEESIDKASPERNLAKALGFGLSYGMGAPKLRDYAANLYGVEMSLEQAKQHRDTYFRLYEGLKRWQKYQSSASRGSFFSSTRYGRTASCRRPDNSFHYTRSFNIPIQGSCADALHEALARLPAALAGLDAHPVIIVHDEIILDTSEADAAVAAERLADVMAEAFLAVFPEVEIMSGLTESAIGDAWANTKA